MPLSSPSAARPATATALWHAENRLFERWQRREPTLLRDGALGGVSSTYHAQPTRILFALKEPNDTNGRWSAHGADLRLHTRAFADLRSTFPVLLLLARLAQEASTDPTLSLSFVAAREDLADPAVRLRLLEGVVLLNLKKTPGGPVCNDRSLHTAVTTHGHLLLEQLSLYQPHLTIAGGSAVFSLLADLTGTPATPPPPPSPAPSSTIPYSASAFPSSIRRPPRATSTSSTSFATTSSPTTSIPNTPPLQ